MSENFYSIKRSPVSLSFTVYSQKIFSPILRMYRSHLVSFLKIQSLQESRFQEPNNYKSSGDRKIRKNDC
ncbi:MAG: hypothetical protein QNJ68_06160, partial [Microcoleaceae cyanobacterium MO_207.B10]|nr:hypothetical protein [Microcoleaceae cyanobacterium MO_207.B10]